MSALIHSHACADQPVDSVAIRFPDFMVTEQELRAAMSSVAPNMLVQVVDWTATIDDRRVPATVGFFVELASDQGITSRLSFSYTSRSLTLDIATQSLISHWHRSVCSTSYYDQTRISLGPSHTTCSANRPCGSSDLGHSVTFGN